MSLIPYSKVTLVALLTLACQAEDYVNIQMMHYSEEEEKATIITPAAELNLGLGGGYTLNAYMLSDVISGGSPTYYDRRGDTVSGASPYSNGTHEPSAYARGSVLEPSDIGYGRVDYRDIRYAGGVHLSKLLQSGDTIGGGVSYSNEHEYRIPEYSLQYQHQLDPETQTSIALHLSYQHAKQQIWCYNTTGCDSRSGASKDLFQRIYNTQLTYQTKPDASIEATLALFYNKEVGSLSNPYMNVVRNYHTEPIILNEVRPGQREGYGGKLSLGKALNNSFSLHGSYRYYQDDWDIDSHTFSSQLFYRYNSRFLWDIGARYYTQTDANFYSDRVDYFTDEQHASSDWRLGSYDTTDLSLGLSFALTPTITQNIQFSHYRQAGDRKAITVFVGQKVRF